MVSLDLSAERLLDRQYAQASSDPGFADLMQGHMPAAEDQLADLIELDGRKRIALGRSVELRRYLEAIPDLTSRTVALDAAIDVTLRSMSLGRRPDSDAVRTLSLNYPHLDRAIRDAAVLGRSMLSTSEVHRGLAADLPTALPADFGPPVADGRARYELVELLGTGASGAVYRAADRQLSDADRPALVAIKLTRFRDRSPWARQRFVEEATKARRITHPNVARVLDRGVAKDQSDYIVYEFVDGGDLQSWFESRSEPLSARLAAALVAKIARAVHAAHVAGLVHCDLKPGNILMTSAGEPKVTDFGIAVRAAGEPKEPADPPSARAPGNLAFTAPEQFRMEEGSLASPADVYAIGGILYFLLTGRYPNGQTPEDIQASHERSSGPAAAPSPGIHRAGLDRDLDAICRRALAHSPDGRHGSAADLASDLEAWLAHQPIYWTGPSLLRILHLWSHRRPWTAVLILLTLLSVGASTGVAIRSWSLASTRAAEAALANATVKTGREQLGRALVFFRALKAQGVDRDLMPMVMALESMLGHTVLGTPENRTILWTERVRIASDIVQEGQAAGHSDDVEVLMWQSAVAFWLVNDGKFNEAAPILEDNLARWSNRLRPDDRWLDQMHAIAACATIQRLRAAGAPPDASPGSPLRLADTDLLKADRAFTGQSAGTPIHKLVLRTLIDLYAADFLNSSKDHRKFEKRLKAFE